MPDYQSMYLHLFNAVTDALAIMDKGSGPAEMLRQAQSECEEIYIADGGEQKRRILMADIEKKLLDEASLEQVTGGENISSFPYLYQTKVIRETEFLSEPRDTFEKKKLLDTLAPGQEVRVISLTVYYDYMQREYLLCKKNIGYMAEGYILKDDLAPRSSK